MSLPTSFWQFLLMAMVGLLAAHLIAAAVLNWSVSTRRQRSPVRRLVQRRLLQRVARAASSGRP
jgi:Flp pilus assembly protein TadB